MWVHPLTSPLGTDDYLSPVVLQWKQNVDNELQEWQDIELAPDVPDTLARCHAHPRDVCIDFTKAGHRYSIIWDPDSKGPDRQPSSEGLVSTTTLIGKYFAKFDADAVIRRMMSRDNWPDSDYYGMTTTGIKQWWDYHGQVASWCGSQMHLSCEHHYNDNHQMHARSQHLVEMKMFRQFVADFPLQPFRTEMRVFTSSQYCVTGSVDMLFVSQLLPTGQVNDQGEALYELHLLIYDWKRSKKLSRGQQDGGWSAKASGMFAHHDDCNWIKYSAQLYTYKFILEHFYHGFEWRGRQIANIVIDELWLVVMHPKQETYQRVVACDVGMEVAFAMKQRRKYVRRYYPHLLDKDPSGRLVGPNTGLAAAHLA
jgi:hypothetical protein